MEISAGARRKMEKGRKGVFSETELEQAAAREWSGEKGMGGGGECALGVRADGLRASANVWRKDETFKR